MQRSNVLTSRSLPVFRQGKAARGWLLAALLGVLLFGSTLGIRAASANDEVACYMPDPERRIVACTNLLARPGQSDLAVGSAYASRALAYSQLRDYDRAIADYDEAIRRLPNSASALNNRAWAYFKSGRPESGRGDVELSLKLDPTSGPALDTRAHIHQATGNPSDALADYLAAIEHGGEEMTFLYQCGLGDQGLYSGPRDGKPNAELRAALAVCGQDRRWDPLPADEFCRPAGS